MILHFRGCDLKCSVINTDIFLAGVARRRALFERPGDPNAETPFGWSIAATDEPILISDPQAEVNGVPGAGTIFVYEGLPEPDVPFYGDANLDGIVDAADLNIVGNNWLHEDVSGW